MKKGKELEKKYKLHCFVHMPMKGLGDEASHSGFWNGKNIKN